MAVKRNWDRPDRVSECCKEGCHNERGTTKQGIISVHCQWHTDEWQMRLDRIEQAHPVPEAVFTTPDPAPVRTQVTVTNAPPPLYDVGPCSRCHQAARAWPDHLCEDCRRG